MKFSLVYTTRRPGSIAPVIALWLDRATQPADVEVILAIDADDVVGINAARTHAAYDGARNVKLVIQSDLPGNCVKGWNLAALNSTGDVIIAIADDFEPPQAWDELLLALKPADWTDREFAVHVNDGYVRTIMTLAIITRRRYERFGYLFYPGYQSLFCDTDLTERAYQDGCVLKAMQLTFEHKHCDNKKRERDAIDLVHSSDERWKQGEQLFNYRKARGFPIDVGPRVEEARETARMEISEKYACYTQAIKDDFCLYEVWRRLYDEGVRNFFACVPDEYWSGDVTPGEHIEEIRVAAERMRTLPACKVNLQIFNVAPHRIDGRSRIDVETSVRNEAIKWVKDAGFQHILIVDGDELWRTGLLKQLDFVVRRELPASVCCGMVPVVGLPGYPVDRAQDKVTIYVASHESFRECRTPHSTTTFMQVPGVVHFTGTRSTMAEIVQKHRDSGHYDDPAYNFEGFIKDTLPNIRPGLKNVHMYRNYQIWPEIRHWRVDELADIPESLHKFMGMDGIQGLSGARRAELTGDVATSRIVPRAPARVMDVAPKASATTINEEKTVQNAMPKIAVRKQTRLDRFHGHGRK
jgi:hypothetical protein